MHPGEFLTEIEHEIMPHPSTPVHITGDDTKTTETERKAPEFGTWRFIQLIGLNSAGGGADTQQLLPQESKRERAIIIIGPGAAANIAGFVMIGSRAQCMNGQGARLYNGNNVIVESASEIWITSDNVNSLSISVLDERYRK